MKTVILIFSLLIFSLIFNVNANGQAANSSNSVKNQTKKQEQDQPLKITGKKPPSTSSFSKCLKNQRDTQLFIQLKVTFHSSGKITDAEIFESSGCEYFDKECLRVAQKIKFKPAIKNGEVVTVTKSIVYKAGIY